ncbi:MAG TPA: DNA mismatch repair endonuclease MutL [Anaerolineaceae bacterium]|nr:DNA mismatch repair endonuclease MutL [Anaerolineaceae bacterium]
MKIKVLSEQLASQIAAGEVIERPSSVVKELIENAIDAGATQIELEIKDAGKKLIQVSDNGVGIPADEIALAVSRHATSKLSKAEDLFDIRTLGFRGEALSSIGSVAKLSIVSKHRDAELGAEVSVDGGKTEGVKAKSAPDGTVVRVEDLFFNVPARLKFLKTNTTENRQITGLVTRYALAYPHIRWQLIQDGRVYLQTTGSGDRKEILQSLFGVSDAKRMLPILFEDGEMRIEGFISELGFTRSNRRDITLFVNGRWVQDASLTAAVIRAYNTMLMVGRFPVVVLFIQMPPDMVDVNVHPSKAEVRFKESDQVFSTVQRAIRRGLLAYSPVPELNTAVLWGRPVEDISTSKPVQMEAPWQMPDQQHEKTEESERVQTGFQPVGQTQSLQAPLSSDYLPVLRLVGQVAATYLIAEGPDGLYLIDQHAAHERVLFEQMMAQARSGIVPSQALLEAAVVELTPEKAGILEERLDVLKGLGFEIENFGPNTFALRAVPAILAGGDPAEAIYAVVNAFEEDETPLMAEIQDLVAARVCKRMAIKAGQILSPEEQKNLLLNLETCQVPRTCPHGRPTMIHLSAMMLERQFGRTGAI